MPAATGVEELRKTFAAERYVQVNGLLEGGLCRMLYQHVMSRSAVATPAPNCGQEGAVEMGSDQLMEFVLAGVMPRIEELSGLTLDPTYSFFRVYQRGNILARHVDRPSCEVSVSVNLGPVLERPWPIWIKGPLSESAVELTPGDAVLYRGIECEHWREPLTGDHLAQVFLHYVERNGTYSDWKFDKRPMLGL